MPDSAFLFVKRIVIGEGKYTTTIPKEGIGISVIWCLIILLYLVQSMPNMHRLGLILKENTQIID